MKTTKLLTGIAIALGLFSQSAVADLGPDNPNLTLVNESGRDLENARVKFVVRVRGPETDEILSFSKNLRGIPKSQQRKFNLLTLTDVKQKVKGKLEKEAGMNIIEVLRGKHITDVYIVKIRADFEKESGETTRKEFKAQVTGMTGAGADIKAEKKMRKAEKGKYRMPTARLKFKKGDSLARNDTFYLRKIKDLGPNDNRLFEITLSSSE